MICDLGFTGTGKSAETNIGFGDLCRFFDCLHNMSWHLTCPLRVWTTIDILHDVPLFKITTTQLHAPYGAPTSLTFPARSKESSLWTLAALRFLRRRLQFVSARIFLKTNPG
jgi:hypothetical protein